MILCLRRSVRSSTYFKFLEGNSTPVDVPVGAPVSLEFLPTIDSRVRLHEGSSIFGRTSYGLWAA